MISSHWPRFPSYQVSHAGKWKLGPTSIDKLAMASSDVFPHINCQPLSAFTLWKVKYLFNLAPTTIMLFKLVNKLKMETACSWDMCNHETLLLFRGWHPPDLGWQNPALCVSLNNTPDSPFSWMKPRLNFVRYWSKFCLLPFAAGISWSTLATSFHGTSHYWTRNCELCQQVESESCVFFDWFGLVILAELLLQAKNLPVLLVLIGSSDDIWGFCTFLQRKKLNNLLTILYFICVTV